MTSRSLGLGRFHTGEDDLVITSNTYEGGGPLVVVCHGAGATPATYLPTHVRRDLGMLAESGCVVVITGLGGLSTWGIDTVVHPTTGRIAEIRTKAALPPWNADTSRMALIGDSMGAMNALNYMWRAPANVSACVLRMPVVAADALHDRNAGMGALIDAAWGSGAAWEAAKADRDPSAAGPAALIAGFADRVRCWYATDDPTVLPADVTSFAAATGVRAVPLGATGHDDDIYRALHAQDEVSWIWSRFNAA